MDKSVLGSAIRYAAYAVLAGTLAAGNAYASLGASPLGAVHTPTQKFSPLTISNSGDEPMNVQVFVYEWTLKDGQRHLERATDIHFSPNKSLHTIEPRSTQAVRLVFAGTVEHEKAYRVLVREIRIRQEGDPEVFYALQHDMPWFWRAPNAAPVVSVTKAGSKWRLHNTGNATARIIASTWNGYVLPGESIEIDPVADTQWSINGHKQSIEVL